MRSVRKYDSHMNCIIKLYKSIHMQQDSPVFSTEVPQSRPTTTLQPARLQAQDSIYDTLKRTKAQARKAHLEYQSQLTAHHKTNTHKSLIKRIQFLKIYSNKKAMLHEKELLQAKRIEKQKMDRKSIDTVKRRKLQSQLQHILRQNEEQDHLCQLHSQNRRDKEKLFTEKNRVRRREIESRHHDDIRRRNNQFMIRKKNLHTSVTMRSRNNYCQKIHEELSLIHHYENIMGEFEQYLGSDQTSFPSKDLSTLCHTRDLNPPLFITARNTIQ